MLMIRTSQEQEQDHITNKSWITILNLPSQRLVQWCMNMIIHPRVAWSIGYHLASQPKVCTATHEYDNVPQSGLIRFLPLATCAPERACSQQEFLGRLPTKKPQRIQIFGGQFEWELKPKLNGKLSPCRFSLENQPKNSCTPQSPTQAAQSRILGYANVAFKSDQPDGLCVPATCVSQQARTERIQLQRELCPSNLCALTKRIPLQSELRLERILTTEKTQSNGPCRSQGESHAHNGVNRCR